MPEFAYVARRPSGERTQGVLTAASRKEALSALASQELLPVRVEPVGEPSGLGLGRGRVPGKYLALFYTQLADLLRSGVPLLRALELLQRQTSHRTLRGLIQQVRDEVADGRPLAEALRRHQRVFGPLAVSMVRAGEEGGFLEEVLKRIAAFLEHQQELKSRTLGAMIYPVFLLVIGTAIVVGMLVFFVPKFAPIFDRFAQQGELPWATQALMSASGFFQQYWVPCLLVLVGAAWAVVHWASTPTGREQLDRLRLRVPLLGRIVRLLAVARFCRILGTLLRSGVPVLRALAIAQDAAGNTVLRQAVQEAAEHVQQGRSLAGPLGASGQFPEDVIEMIAVGEEANNLEQVLIDIAETIERRTARLLDALVRLLEPLLLILMAGMVLFVVIALLGPILQSSSIM